MYIYEWASLISRKCIYIYMCVCVYKISHYPSQRTNPRYFACLFVADKEPANHNTGQPP